MVCVGLVVAGCGTSGAPPEPQPTAAPDDLARLAEVQKDIPEADYLASFSEPKRLPERNTEILGAYVTFGKDFTIEPMRCGAVLKPVDVPPGAERAAVTAKAVRGRGQIAIEAYRPATLAANLFDPGCNRVSYRVEELQNMTGTVTRLPAPEVAGAETFALQNAIDGFPEPEYYYGAFLGDDVYVGIHARLEGAEPVPLLPDLLTSAVTALRAG